MNNMTDKAVHTFSIIKHYLSPNAAVTMEGHTVRRETKIWLNDPSGWGRFIQCAEYDNHFIYLDPEFLKGTVGKCATMCTCGSYAVIVGYDAYKHDASPAEESTQRGEMLICHVHASYGRHADGST